MSDNTGGWNSGGWNSGGRNTGDWNSGDWNTGFLNTITPKILIFNKETDLPRSEINFPDFFYFILCEWIYLDDMTEEEKKDHCKSSVKNGYLKTYDYKEAWKKSWDNAEEEDRKKVFDLPNFDAEIFEEISGINVYEDNNCVYCSKCGNKL